MYAVADLAARHRRVTQVVVPRHVLVPQPRGRAAPLDDLHAQRRQLVHGSHHRGLRCVFRIIVTARFGIVTARFGIVTAEFGNVTDRFGDVTDGFLKAA